MKKEAMTIKNTKKLISDKVTQGMDIAKEETNDVMGQGQEGGFRGQRGKERQRLARDKKLVKGGIK